MPKKLERPYWQPNPQANSHSTPEKTPRHEALHAAVAYILGYEPYRIRVNKDGSGIVDRRWENEIGWHRAAIHMAPVLIDDLAKTDAEQLVHVNPHTRGYAWRWLKQNRRKIMREANKMVRNMGKPGGTLWLLDDGTMEWMPRKRTKR